MFRKPVYLLILALVFFTIGVLEYRRIAGLQKELEELEKQLLQDYRTFTMQRMSLTQLVGLPSRSITYIDLREMQGPDDKTAFLRDFFTEMAKSYGFNGQAKVELGVEPEWLSVLRNVGGVNVYRVELELENYPSFLALSSFLSFLKNLPVTFESLEIGGGGQKKAFIKLVFNFFETYEE